LGGCNRDAAEPMLITLPPCGPKCWRDSRITSIGPSTLVLNSRWNSSTVIASNGIVA